MLVNAVSAAYPLWLTEPILDWPGRSETGSRSPPPVPNSDQRFRSNPLTLGSIPEEKVYGIAFLDIERDQVEPSSREGHCLCVKH
jgi:hypothetical protein